MKGTFNSFQIATVIYKTYILFFKELINSSICFVVEIFLFLKKLYIDM